MRATLTLQPLRQTATAAARLSDAAARLVRVDKAVACVPGVPSDSTIAAATASTKPCKGGGTAPVWTTDEHDSDLALNMDLGGSAKLPSSVLVLIEVMNKNMVQADALIGRATVQLPLLVGSEAPQELSVELDTGGTVHCSMFFVNDDEAESGQPDGDLSRVMHDRLRELRAGWSNVCHGWSDVCGRREVDRHRVVRRQGGRLVLRLVLLVDVQLLPRSRRGRCLTRSDLVLDRLDHGGRLGCGCVVQFDSL